MDAGRFEQAVAPHRTHWAIEGSASVLAAGSSDPWLREHGEVAFGQPDPEDLFHAKRLKLVCLSSAGYTRYDRDDLRAYCRSAGLVIANASGVYDEPCAQHVFAMMLAIARQLPAALDAQRIERGWPTASLRAGSTLLSPETRVAIIGYGSIARRLVELLAPLRVQVVALRRSPRGDENCLTKPITDVDAALAEADHVVNILPASKETSGFFDARRLSRMRQGTAFYNIGRGDTVDQTALNQPCGAVLYARPTST